MVSELLKISTTTITTTIFISITINRSKSPPRTTAAFRGMVRRMVRAVPAGILSSPVMGNSRIHIIAINIIIIRNITNSSNIISHVTIM
jgi:hypothetical protein